MTSEAGVKVALQADDVKLGLIRIHDTLVPAGDYARLLLLAGEALPKEQAPAITRGAYACLEAIEATKQLIDELRETGGVDYKTPTD